MKIVLSMEKTLVALRHIGQISAQVLEVVPKDAALLHYVQELELGNGDLINSKWFAVKLSLMQAIYYPQQMQAWMLLQSRVILSQINKPVQHLLIAVLVLHVSHTISLMMKRSNTTITEELVSMVHSPSFVKRTTITSVEP